MNIKNIPPNLDLYYPCPFLNWNGGQLLVSCSNHSAKMFHVKGCWMLIYIWSVWRCISSGRLIAKYATQPKLEHLNTVDGRNPAPPGMVKTL